MPKIRVKCANCGEAIEAWPSRFKKFPKLFCNKACHRAYKNTIDNPSKHRDLSGENNPMYGTHPRAWNKGVRGEKCHNWKGGIHTRKDGYVRINIDGVRYLFHRWLLKDKDLKDGVVVHHIDHNPSNNNPDNLMIFSSQAEHVRFEKNNPTPGAEVSC